ncbi:MAG: hypothetical protein AB7O39_05330 [Flavobacteriaceae bacterium]
MDRFFYWFDRSFFLSIAIIAALYVAISALSLVSALVFLPDFQHREPGWCYTRTAMLAFVECHSDTPFRHFWLFFFNFGFVTANLWMLLAALSIPGKAIVIGVILIALLGPAVLLRVLRERWNMRGVPRSRQ